MRAAIVHMRYASAGIAGRKLVALAVAAAFAGTAGSSHAAPTNPTVVSGSAVFNQAGNTLNITNTPGTIINWQGFSISQAEITRFIQQSNLSAVLNRVTGSEQSAILGQLLSNGRVFLINPNGIFIGGGAVIDTAGFVASSLKLTDADFLGGRYKFDDVPGAGKVVNQGTIRAGDGGFVYLVAPNVENHGVITSPTGEIVLAAGKTVELVNVNSPSLRVQISAPDNSALNVGQLIASAGTVGIFGTVVRNGGRISADSASVNAAGRVVLRATKNVTLDPTSVITANGPTGGSVSITSDTATVRIDGRVEAIGSAGAGGSIDIRGAQIEVARSAIVDASGATAGGTISMIAQAAIAGAERALVRVEGGARILARATQALVAGAGIADGVGGSIILKGDAIEVGADPLNNAALAAVEDPVAEFAATGAGQGGVISLQAGEDITLGVNAILNAGGGRGGVVEMRAVSGRMFSAADLGAYGSDGPGGAISLLGSFVALIGRARVDARGRSGGGVVLVGGDFQGKNADVQNAARTYVSAETVIDASAIETGDGGKVIVWSDGDTRYYGSIAARGGVTSGNGGLVEVSGKGVLVFNGRVDTSAPNGAAGWLLLDPQDITIVDGTGGADDGLLADNVVGSAEPNTTTNVTISEQTLEGLSGNVTLQASRDVILGNISDDLVDMNLVTAGSTFTITAGRDIIGTADVNDRFQTNGGAVNISTTAGQINIGGIRSKGGAVTLNAGGAGGNMVVREITTTPGGGTGGAISLTSGGFMTLGGANIDARGSGGAGNVTLVSAGALSAATTTYANDLSISAVGGISNGASATVISASKLKALNSGSGDIKIQNTGSNDIELDDLGGGPSVGVRNLAAGGAVSISSTLSKIVVSKSVTASAGAIELVSDKIDIQAAVNSGSASTGSVSLKPWSNGRVIDLGSVSDSTANTLELSNAELGNVTTGLLSIGASGYTGGIQLSTNISLPNAGAVSLKNGGNINAVSTETITTANLNVESLGTVNLGGSNAVGTLSGKYVTAFTFKNNAALNIGAVDTGSGIIETSTGGALTLESAGAMNLNSPLNAGTGAISLTTTGTLSNINFASGLTVTGGSLTMAGTGAAAFNSGTVTLNAPVTSTAIPVNIGGATVNFNGATNSINTLSFSSGVLQGTGNVTSNTAFNWSGGTIGGSGVITADGTAAFSGSLSLSNKAITLNGAATLSSGSLSLSNATINGTGTLSNSGTLTVVGSATSAINSGFSNSGTLRIDSGASSSPTTLTVANGFTNNGLIELLTNPGSGGGTGVGVLNITTGTLTNASGATLRSAGTGTTNASTYNVVNAVLTNQGTIDTQRGLTITNTGRTFTSDAGTLGISTGQLLTVDGGTTTLGSGTVFSGTGTLSLLNTPVLNLASDLTLSSGSITLDLNGTSAATISAAVPGKNLNIGSGAALSLKNDTIASSVNLVNAGTVTVAGTSTSAINGGLTNTGTLRIDSGASSSPTTLTVASGFTNSGLIELLTNPGSGGGTGVGVLNITTGTLTNASGATLRSAGTGTTNASTYNVVNAVLTNQGTIDTQRGLTITNTGRTFTSDAGTLGISAGQLLTVDGGTTTLGSGTVFSGTGTLSLFNTPVLNLASDLTLSSGSITLDLNGTSAATISAAVPGKNLNIGSGAALSLQADTIASSVNLVNAGTVTVVGSTTSNINGGLTNTGTLRVDSGASSSPTTLTVANGFTNNGLIELLTNPGSGGGTGLGVLNITSGTLANAAGATIRSAGTGTTNASTYNALNAAVTNLGTMDLQRGLGISNFAVNDGTINFSVNSSELTLTNATFTNNKTIAVLGGVTGTLTVGSTTNAATTGLIDLSAGNLTVASATQVNNGTITLGAGRTYSASGNALSSSGLIQGTGTVSASTLSSSGNVAPGGVGTVGTLNITGNYTQTGTLTVDLGSGAQDLLAVSGVATLGGTLTGNLIGGYTGIGASANHQIMTFASRVSDFAIIGGLGNFSAVPGSTDYRLRSGGTRTWLGGSDLLWTTAANWSGSSVPTSLDDVVVPDLPGTTTIDLNASVASVKSLTFSGNDILAVPLSSSLSFSNASSMSSATLAISGGTVNANASLSLGTLTMSSGTFNLPSTATIGSVQLNGGTINATGTLTGGVLNLLAGSLLGGGNLTVSSDFNQTGGSLLNNWANLSLKRPVSWTPAALTASGNLSLASGGVLTMAAAQSAGGALSLNGTSGIELNAGFTTTGSLNLSSAGAINVNGAVVQSGTGMVINAGSLNILGSAAPAALIAGSTLDGTVTGDVHLTGGSGSGASARLKNLGGSFSLKTGGDLELAGGTGSGAFAHLLGNPDTLLNVGGKIEFTSGATAAEYARIESQSPTSIKLTFPSLGSGGYTVNGAGVVASGGTGFYAGGAPAVLGTNLLITYGVTATPTFTVSETLLAPLLTAAQKNTSSEQQKEKEKEKEDARVDGGKVEKAAVAMADPFEEETGIPARGCR